MALEVGDEQSPVRGRGSGERLMVTMLSEDPTYLASGLALLGGTFLAAVRVTQQGKYLIWALASLGLAGLVVLVDWVWVTDNERIEQVVYDLRRAVLNSDPQGVMAHLTPDVQYIRDGNSISGELTRGLIESNVGRSEFDFVHIRDLQVSAGRQTRRGKAEFQVYAKGKLRTTLADVNIGTANSTWSLGFQETAPGVWKVNRITPISIPSGAINVPRAGISSGLRPPPPETRGSEVDPAEAISRRRGVPFRIRIPIPKEGGEGPS